MDISTVKIVGDGYLVNGVMSVPKDDGNRHYKMIKKWESEGNIPESEFTQEELDQHVIVADSQLAKKELAQLDLDSIRDIREWIAARPDAPQALKDREELAIAARGRVI